MKNIKFKVYKEGDYYISKCLNIELSSFGSSIDEAIVNLTEALNIYFEGAALKMVGSF